MSKTPDPKYRPAPEDRWIDGMRTEPVRLAVRTEWLYDEEPRIVAFPEGRTHWPFARGGNVTASDVPAPRESQQDLNSHMHRAMTAFGDDKDLIVEVRLAEPEPRTTPQSEPALESLASARVRKDYRVTFIVILFAVLLPLVAVVLALAMGEVFALLGWLCVAMYATHFFIEHINRMKNARSNTPNTSNTPDP